jgi:hypothetical protein
MVTPAKSNPAEFVVLAEAGGIGVAHENEALYRSLKSASSSPPSYEVTQFSDTGARIGSTVANA